MSFDAIARHSNIRLTDLIFTSVLPCFGERSLPAGRRQLVKAEINRQPSGGLRNNLPMQQISRRGFLGASAALLTGCSARRASIVPTPGQERLPSVRVDSSRVIRVTTGLRPFRPSGFVVRAEKMDAKTVIHNYGHGGAGITLSWGTANLAVQEAAGIAERDCAVIGCGVVGLSTARLLQQRGYRPVIYSKAIPPDTTSNAAGGLWEPVSLFDDARVTTDFRRQFGDASRYAFRRYQSMAGDEYGVRWLPLFRLGIEPATVSAPAADSLNADIESLYPEIHRLSPAENPFGVPYAERRYSMLIEPAIYLHALMRDFFMSGGRIVIRDFAAKAELMSLPESLIFNCTGLGARTLFGDAELIPIKGQLVFLLPQPEVQYMTIGPPGAYMFPRHDGILLGGSFQRGVDNLEPDPAVTGRILQLNQGLFKAMR
jgi:D-amino-acid oxidase